VESNFFHFFLKHEDAVIFRGILFRRGLRRWGRRGGRRRLRLRICLILRVRPKGYLQADNDG
jgi:hypothetical protein